MNKSGFAAAALASAIALAGCHGERDHHDDKAAGGDSSAVAEQLRRDEAQWVEDWASRDADRVLAHYADGATLMVTGAPRLAGAQLRSTVEAMVADPNLELRFVPDRIVVASSGDLAYARGTYSLRSTNAQTRQPQAESGNYVIVYRRQPDGSWKAVEDIVSAGPPTAP